jgi:hypothetical protein
MRCRQIDAISQHHLKRKRFAIGERLRQRCCFNVGIFSVASLKKGLVRKNRA